MTVFEHKTKLNKIIARAQRMGHVKDGLVHCDNCSTPASATLSIELGWTCCAPCVWGKADLFDAADLIHVEAPAHG